MSRPRFPLPDGLGPRPQSGYRSDRISRSLPSMAKSPCPLSKTQFLEKAEAAKVSIGGNEMIADKREFSTGRFGWYYNGKTTIRVEGKPLSVQVGMNLIVVG